MNKVQLSFAVIFLFLTSCAGNKEKDPEVADTNIAKETTIHCYQKITGNDTMLLTVNKTGQKVTGVLIYDFFEKDRSDGMFSGQLYGDTLIAEYTYKSEGKESARDIAFLLKEIDAVEGYGVAEEKNGIFKFTDRTKIDFSDSLIYKNIPCPPQK